MVQDLISKKLSQLMLPATLTAAAVGPSLSEAPSPRHLVRSQNQLRFHHISILMNT